MEKEFEKVDTYICITELLGCTFEANTTLLSNYAPI